jgi:hypothetical protein
MGTFLSMEVKQNKIKLNLDYYIQETLAEYKVKFKRIFCPKRVLMFPGVILSNKGCPKLSEQPAQAKGLTEHAGCLSAEAEWGKRASLRSKSGT